MLSKKEILNSLLGVKVSIYISDSYISIGPFNDRQSNYCIINEVGDDLIQIHSFEYSKTKTIYHSINHIISIYTE